jgi:hypothetical protein
MATSTNMRTIWISLRATNYTTQVFGSVMRQCDALDKKEKMMVRQNLRLASAAVSAGMMFQAMGSQMGGAGGQILDTAGKMFTLIGAVGYLRAMLPLLSKAFWIHSVSVLGTSMAYWQLAVASGAAFGAFALIYNALLAFNNPVVSGVIAVILAITAALWALFVAESAASMGVALAIGGAAAGAAAATAKQLGAFQMGTRMIGATGPVIAHRGEIIYNPASGRPTQVQNDLGGKGGTSTLIEMPVTIENVHTKADIDDVDRELSRALKKAANRSK